MKIGAFILALIASVFFVSHAASAHVLITDGTNKMGAVLHIIPDDDPVAGEPATLYFDMQTNENPTVELRIQNKSGNNETLTMKVDGALATIEYTFPSQGVYELTFNVKTSSSVYTFTQSQRISRGVSSSALDQPDYAWAQVALITSVVGVLVLIILAVNNRKEIAKHSTF